MTKDSPWLCKLNSVMKRFWVSQFWEVCLLCLGPAYSNCEKPFSFFPNPGNLMLLFSNVCLTVLWKVNIEFLWEKWKSKVCILMRHKNISNSYTRSTGFPVTDAETHDTWGCRSVPSPRSDLRRTWKPTDPDPKDDSPFQWAWNVSVN